MKKHIFLGLTSGFLAAYLLAGAFSVVRQVAKFRSEENANLSAILGEEPPRPKKFMEE